MTRNFPLVSRRSRDPALLTRARREIAENLQRDRHSVEQRRPVAQPITATSKTCGAVETRAMDSKKSAHRTSSQPLRNSERLRRNWNAPVSRERTLSAATPDSGNIKMGWAVGPYRQGHLFRRAESSQRRMA